MNRSVKRALVLATIVGGAAAMLIGYRRELAPRSSPIARGGTLIAAIRTEPRSFNRLAARDTTSDLVSALTQGRLVRINHHTDAWEPWLVKQWEASADRQTYTLTLRDHVTFSDGHPLSSADVVFSFDAAYDERTASSLADSLLIGGKRLEVSAPDARTVIVRFPAPFGPGLRILDNLPILPKHRLEPAMRAGTLRSAWGVTVNPSEIAGLGPFVLDRYFSGQRVILKRNPRYWRRDGSGAQLPYVDQLILKVVPEQNSEILQLDAGDVDLLQSEVRPDDVPALRRAVNAGRVRLYDVGLSLDPSFLLFNLRPANDAARPWLRSLELRKAISHAVDREEFANTVFLGEAEPVHGAVTPGNRKWFSPNAPRYVFDRARAKALLAAVGLADRNGDGWLEDEAGAPARFSLLTQKGNTSRERAAAVLQEDLRRIGVQVDVVAMEPGALITRIMSGGFETAYFGTLASDTDPAVNLDFWMSSGAFHPWHPGQRTPATEWEAQIDALMMRQIASTDEGERKRLFGEVQRIFAEHLPLVYFATPRVYVATSARVANVAPVLLRPQVLWNADELVVKSDLRTH